MPVAEDDVCVRDYERKQLLERVEREGSTIGSRIPEELEVQGERIALREFVLEAQRRSAVPPDQHERVNRAKRALRRERRDRLDRLETAPIDREEGERLVESIVGIDRALEALDQLDAATSVTDEIEAREQADRKRWISFLGQVTGRKSKDSRRR